MLLIQSLLLDISGDSPLTVFVCIAVVLAGIFTYFAFRKSGGMQRGGPSVSTFNDPTLFADPAVYYTVPDSTATHIDSQYIAPPIETPRADLGLDYRVTFDPIPMPATIDFTPSPPNFDPPSAPTDSSSDF